MQKRGQRVVNNKHSGNIRKHAVNDNTHLACQYNNRRVRDDLRTDVFLFKLGLFVEGGWVTLIWVIFRRCCFKKNHTIVDPTPPGHLLYCNLLWVSNFPVLKVRYRLNRHKIHRVFLFREIDLNLWRKMLRKGSARFQRLNRIDRQEGERAWDKNKVIVSQITSDTFI